MLWYKSWLETRWRFLLGLGVLMCSAVVTVLAYPRIAHLLPLVPPIDTTTAIGRQIKEAADLAREYRGYIWSQWYRQNMPQMWVLFAALLGTGGLLSEGSRGVALFTLSLPASRSRLLGVRAAAALGELLVLAVVPSLLVPLLSPGVGESYGIVDALVHALCLFVAGATFFSLAFLLSTVFGDVWRPLLIAVGVAIVLAVSEKLFRESASGLFGVMSGESYFRGGRVPWLGLLAAGSASAAMLYGASVNFAHRDF